MKGRLENRLVRLEGRLPPDNKFKDMTNDELAVFTLNSLRHSLASAELGEATRDFAIAEVERIEAEARWQASLARHPAYAAALDRMGKLIPGFVPAIFGSVGCENGWVEVAELEKAQLMERRAALRSRPDIRELVEAGAKEIATVDFGGRYVARDLVDWTPPPMKRRGVSPKALGGACSREGAA